MEKRYRNKIIIICVCVCLSVSVCRSVCLSASQPTIAVSVGFGQQTDPQLGSLDRDNVIAKRLDAVSILLLVVVVVLLLLLLLLLLSLLFVCLFVLFYFLRFMWRFRENKDTLEER